MESISTPKPAIDKYESSRVRVQIRGVLLNVWDPIGVRNDPNAQDEYDGYLGDIFELLVRRASRKKIVEYLYWVASVRMGMDAKRSDMLPTVEALMKIPLS